MNKNIIIGLKLIVVMILFMNIPYPKVYSSAIDDSETNETQGEVQNVVSKSNGKSIYIYNTHQIEKYDGGSVIEGSKYLMKLLESKGYEVVYETNDFEKYKDDRGINYRYSYTVSKLFIKQAIENHGEFNMLIDFHRDSVAKSATTLNDNNKSYAKLMFVVGKSSSNYPTTKEEASKLSVALNKKVEGISRGVYEKKSHYNQSIAKNMFLIEVGANENTYTEVKNSLVILADVIDSYLS